VHDEEDVRRITPVALEELLRGADAPLILDVRSRSTFERDGAQIPGSVRVLPDDVAEWATDHPKERLVVAYCT
jgi:rhodanese-related sulfurtransferase